MVSRRAMSKKAAKLKLSAPAKINLFLEVLGTRPNGYHDIRSILVPVNVYDELEISSAPRSVTTIVAKGSLVSGSDLVVARNGDNLATRAALMLKDFTGHRGGVTIKLKKRIPIGGGLGGGSSDAAAVLVGLNRLWDTGLSTNELMKIGSRIGCDVPAMVHGGAVLMEGLGEIISPVPAGFGKKGSGFWLVLVNPGFNVSTKDIYSRCKVALTSGRKTFNNLLSALKEGNLDLAAQNLFNGLQDIVYRKYPLIAIAAERLAQAGAAGVMLSGSGASVFGLARDERHAQEIAGRAGRAMGFPAWIKVAKTLPDGVIGSTRPFGGLSSGSSPDRAASVRR